MKHEKRLYTFSDGAQTSKASAAEKPGRRRRLFRRFLSFVLALTLALTGTVSSGVIDTTTAQAASYTKKTLPNGTYSKYGNVFDNTAAQFKFTSSNAVLTNLSSKVGTVTVDGKKYFYIKKSAWSGAKTSSFSSSLGSIEFTNAGTVNGVSIDVVLSLDMVAVKAAYASSSTNAVMSRFNVESSSYLGYAFMYLDSSGNDGVTMTNRNNKYSRAFLVRYTWSAHNHSTGASISLKNIGAYDVLTDIDAGGTASSGSGFSDYSKDGKNWETAGFSSGYSQTFWVYSASDIQKDSNADGTDLTFFSPGNSSYKTAVYDSDTSADGSQGIDSTVVATINGTTASAYRHLCRAISSVKLYASQVTQGTAAKSVHSSPSNGGYYTTGEGVTFKATKKMGTFYYDTYDAYSSMTMTDTLPNGITYKTTSVYSGSKKLTQGTDYTVSQSGQTVTVTMSSSWLNSTGNYTGQTITWYLYGTVTSTYSATSAGTITNPKAVFTINGTAYNTGSASIQVNNFSTITAQKKVVDPSGKADSSLDGYEMTLSGTITSTGATYSAKTTTSSSGVATFTNVPYGTYTITETGYANGSSDVWDTSSALTVATSNTNKSPNAGTITNTYKTGSVSISKTITNDSSYGTHEMSDMTGFEFLLSGTSDGGDSVSVTLTTDSEGKAYAEGIPIGTYKLEETGVPNGEIISSWTISPTEITVSYSTASEITLVNNYNTGDISVTKSVTNSSDKYGTKSKEGWGFSLNGLSNDGDTVSETSTTGSDGIATFANIPIGVYVIAETGTADGTHLEGWETTYSDVTLTLGTDEVKAVSATNVFKTGDLTVRKDVEGVPDDAPDWATASGFTFVLSGKSESYEDVYETRTTDASGEASFENIPVGTYTLTEILTDAPKDSMNWSPTVTEQTVTIGYDEEVTVDADNVLLYGKLTSTVVNGTIDDGKTETTSYAERNIYNRNEYTVSYAPKEGYLLESVTIDGKEVDITDYSSSWTFTEQDAEDHDIVVVYAKPEMDKQVHVTSDGTLSATDDDGMVVDVSDTLTYEISYNNPTGTSRQITIVDTLPDGVTVDESSITSDGVLNTEAGTNGTVIWAFTAAAHEAGEVSFTCSLEESTKNETLKNSATVQLAKIKNSSESDVSLTDDVETPVLETPLKWITGSDGEDLTNTVVNGDGTYMYHISLSNPSADEKTFVITDTLPSGITVDESSVSNDGVYNADTRTLTWSMTLAGGQTQELTCDLTVDDPSASAKIYNRALVHVDYADEKTVTTTGTEGIPDTPLYVLEDPKKTILAVDGSVAADQAVRSAGEVLEYQIAFGNPSDEMRVFTVTDVLDERLEFTEASVNGYNAEYSYDEQTRTVTFTCTLEADETATMSVFAELLDSAKGEIVPNKATVSVSNAVKVTNTVETPVLDDPVKDVTVSTSESETADDTVIEADSAQQGQTEQEQTTSVKSVNGGVVSAGQELIYTISITNPSDLEKTAIVTDELDELSEYQASSDEGVYDETTRTVYWNIALAGHETRVLTLTVRVAGSAADTEITNGANVTLDTASLPTITYDGETKAEKTRVYVPKKSVADTEGNDIDAAIVAEGEMLTYTVTWKNPSLNAKTITITDVLDEGLEFAEAENGIYAEETRTVTWTIEAEGEAEGTVSFTATVNDKKLGEVIENIATVTSENPDGTDKTTAVTNKVTNEVEVPALITQPQTGVFGNPLLFGIIAGALAVAGVIVIKKKRTRAGADGDADGKE